MGILTTEYKHISGTDELEIAVLRMEPDNAAAVRGAVVIVHGMCEHKGRYDAFQRFLAEQGYIAVSFDHRGHGESVRSPQDLGFLYEGGYIAMILDMHEIVKETKRYAEASTGGRKLPFYMIAHSMGTLCARCYLRDHDDELDKLVLLGCPSKLSGMKPGLKLVQALINQKGGHERSKIVDFIVGNGYEKAFAKEHTPHAWTNSDPEEVRIFNEDPLCGYTFTLNGYENLIKLAMLTYRDGGYGMRNPELPIRFYSGGDDPCAISREKLGEAIKLLRKQGYKNSKGKIYPGMRHEILREREKEKVWADILNFLEDGAEGASSDTEGKSSDEDND